MASSDVLDVHFIVGNRSELDHKFRTVVAGEKSPDETMSDFIKHAVVERYEANEKQQQESSAVEKVRQDLMERIQKLEEQIRAGYTPRENSISEQKDIKKNDKVSKLSSAW